MARIRFARLKSRFRPTQQHGAACIKAGSRPRRSNSSRGSHRRSPVPPAKTRLNSLVNSSPLFTFAPQSSAFWASSSTQASRSAGAGVAVHHGHRVACGGGNHINLRVNFAQGLFQHHHGKHAGAGADIAGAGAPRCWWRPCRCRRRPPAGRAEYRPANCRRGPAGGHRLRVRVPASAPAGRTSGSMRVQVHGIALGGGQLVLNFCSMAAS